MKRRQSSARQEEGRCGCAFPCVHSLFGDRAEGRLAAEWWWYPLGSSSIENEDMAEDQTKMTKTHNLKGEEQTDKQQKRDEKKHNNSKRQTVIVKRKTKLAKMQPYLQKWNKVNGKPQICKTGIKLKDIHTPLEMTAIKKKFAGNASLTQPKEGSTNVPKQQRVVQRVSTKGVVQGPSKFRGTSKNSFRPQLPRQKTIPGVPLRRLSNMQVVVGVLVVIHMILVEVFGFILYF